MKKSGFRDFKFHDQRGAVGGPSEAEPPSLAALAQQGAELATRIQRLQAGINNLVQLEQVQAADGSQATERQAAAAELQRLQQAVDEFELTLMQSALGWQQVRETFWLAVRFGGLGLVLGWLLAWLVQRGG
jgi:hypothetical protein